MLFLEAFLVASIFFPCWVPSLRFFVIRAMEEFLKNGEHSQILTHQAILSKGTAEDNEIFKRIRDERDKIDELLKNIKGSPLNKCPYDKDLKGEGSYIFWRGDWILRDLINIRKETDNFFMSIGVKYKNDSSWKDDPKTLQPSEYYLMSTNGSLNDI